MKPKVRGCFATLPEEWQLEQRQMQYNPGKAAKWLWAHASQISLIITMIMVAA